MNATAHAAVATPVAPPAIPALPAEAIQRALDAGEWDMAADLLTQHEHAVRAALSAGDPGDAREPWLALLAAQRTLLEQLQAARGETAQSLQRLNRERRGAQAYLADAG